ncbi:zinc-dependent peptidase [Niveibacterium sp.]|uniref:M90 family metallopeptidase n=1 Tax=Niveibacterium sp. TaxID=2017444 RepID=UPI0035B1CEC9
MRWLKRLWSSSPIDQPRSDDVLAEAEAALPFLRYLTPESLVRLRQMATTFLARKEFAGAAGLEITAFMQASIALQACLPVLELGLEAYDGWVGIVVYPGEFVIPRREIDEDGVLHEYTEDALGEAWDGGPVVLAWLDDPDEYEGANVVVHEFAHKLDMLNGDADGLPPLHAGMSVEAWDAALGAYEHFCERVDAGEDTEIDPYASEHPAEFFAVLSEVFFVEPALLRAIYPDVYLQLAQFYRQDPLHAAK